IEWEKNGLVRYDRSMKEFGYDPSKVVFSSTLPLIDAPPCLHCSTGQEITLPIYFTNYTPSAMDEVTIEWGLQGIDDFGHCCDAGSNGSSVMQDVRYGLWHVIDLEL